MCISTVSSSSCCWPTDQPTRVDKDDFSEATKRSQSRPFTLSDSVLAAEQLRGSLFTYLDALVVLLDTLPAPVTLESKGTSNPAGGENVSPLRSPGDEHDRHKWLFLTHDLDAFFETAPSYNWGRVSCLPPVPVRKLDCFYYRVSSTYQWENSRKGKDISEQFIPTDMERLIFQSQILVLESF